MTTHDLADYSHLTGAMLPFEVAVHGFIQDQLSVFVGRLHLVHRQAAETNLPRLLPPRSPTLTSQPTGGGLAL
jgi:hypothetical protein